MQEKILGAKKNGMKALVLISLLYLLGVALFVVGAIAIEGNFFVSVETGTVLMVVGGIWLCVGWLPYMGLKILKPQEALVLTLFGKYIGTLKGEGFYYVNPFCGSVNPAAKTRLNQSGDVSGGEESASFKLNSSGE